MLKENLDIITINLIRLPFDIENYLLKNSKKKYEIFLEYLSLNSDLFNYLNEEDFFKSEQYIFLNDAKRYLITRAFLKKIIAVKLKLDASKISYTYGKYKKPFLRSENNLRKINFNLSHSREYLAICTSLTSEVGVDIEFIEKSNNIDLLKNQIFSDYELEIFSNLKTVEDKTSYFYRIWAIKESILKGIGVGLFYPPNMLSVFSENSAHPRVINLSSCEEERDFSSWQNQVLDFHENYAFVFSYKGAKKQYELVRYEI